MATTAAAHHRDVSRRIPSPVVVGSCHQVKGVVYTTYSITPVCGLITVIVLDIVVIVSVVIVISVIIVVITVFVIVIVIFTALHGMQTRSSMRILSVCLSICLSVC